MLTMYTHCVIVCAVPLLESVMPKKYQPLIAARKKAKLTQSRAAVLLGVSLRTYCHWEAGTTTPRGGNELFVTILESKSPVLVSKTPPDSRIVTRCAPLIAARKKAKLTQAQAAALLGVSLRAYCHWEAGTAVPLDGLGQYLGRITGIPAPAPCVLCGHVSKAI